MTIIDNIYKQVIEQCSSYQMETGGIIGGKNEVVHEFIFDIGHKGKDTGCYIPRVDFLNCCIADWQQKEIQFYGIFHSHYQLFGYVYYSTFFFIMQDLDLREY